MRRAPLGLRWLAPDHYHTVVCAIDLHGLREAGIRALLVDFDNTLVPRKSAEVTDELVRWLAEVRAHGLEVCVVSNNWGGAIAGVVGTLGVRLVPRALKPLPFPFLRAMRALGVNANECAVIGDQLFTDVLGGKLVGAVTVLVKPLAGSDLPHTLFLRFIERRIMADREPRS